MKEEKQKEPKLDLPQIDRNAYISERIRSLCRDGVELSAPNIVAIANGEIEDATPQTQVRAFVALATHGMSPASVLIQDHELLATVVRVTSKHIPEPAAYHLWYCDLAEALSNP